MKKFFLTIFVLALAVVLVRAAMPLAIKAYINKTLRGLPDYSGRVEDVDLRVLAGGMRLKGLNIVKKTPEGNLPFISAQYLDAAWTWRDLFKKTFIGQIFIERPEVSLTVVPGEKKEKEKMTAKDMERKVAEQGQKLRDLPPFKITSIKAGNGSVAYHDEQKKPEIHLDVEDVQAEVTNITNRRELSPDGTAYVKVTGKPMGTGELIFNLNADQFAVPPRLELKLKMKVELAKLNNLLRSQFDFDVAGGVLNLAAEFAAAEGMFRGYVKPTIDHLDVMDWKKDKKKDAGRILKKAAVGAASEILKNAPKDRLGTKIPISGRFENPKIGVWEAVTNLLRNAFSRALFPGVEGSVSVKDVKKEADKIKKRKSSQKSSF